MYADYVDHAAEQRTQRAAGTRRSEDLVIQRRLIPDEEMALHVHLGQGSLQLRISRGSGEADPFIEFCDTLKAP